jgi:hypothetical protein
MCHSDAQIILANQGFSVNECSQQCGVLILLAVFA